MPSIVITAGSIVLVKYPTGNAFSDIYIATPNGHLIQVTDGISETPPYDNFDADWSPDGNQLIFSTLRNDPTQKQNTEIYTLEVANPSNLQRITNSAFLDESPHWSGAAGKIAFVSNRHNNGAVQIYSMNPDGTGVQRLTNNQFEDLSPRWNPSGSKIAFDRRFASSISIFVMDADASNEVRPGDVGFSQSPDWSPDGSQIVFSSNLHDPQSGHFELYVMDSSDADGEGQGENLVRITNSDATVGNHAPFWAPDGSRIIFSRSQSGSNDELFTVAPDGSGLVQITADQTSNHTGGKYLP